MSRWLTALAFAVGLNAASVVLSSTASAGAAYPLTYLEVTTRQQEEGGTLSRSIHIFRLFCDGNTCSIRILTLNQCIAIMGRRVFYPDIEEHRTDSGDLTVVPGAHSILARWTSKTITGSAEMTARFDYRNAEAGGLISSLKAFQGDFVKRSTETSKTHRIKFVPIREFESVPMDCPAGALKTVDPS